MSKPRKKIILSGGGTGGSVTPLFYIYRELQNEYDFLFIGTYRGLEKNLVQQEGIRYRAILSGKWRRYFSFLNFTDLFKIFLASFQSFFLLVQERPDLIISAGGFVSVPLSWSAWLLRIPLIVHQQDVRPGLANKIMAKTARVVTVTFPSTLKYYGSRAKLIGNLGPDLKNLKLSEGEREKILIKYKINKEKLPLILVLGGGGGSRFINKMIYDSLEDLVKIARIIHISGNRETGFSIRQDLATEGYYSHLNLVEHQDLIILMSLADLLISRCGLATLTELSFLQKPAILIPMPQSHQEDNAEEFLRAEGALVWRQEELDSSKFIEGLKNILNDTAKQKILKNNISLVVKRANQEMIKIIKDLLL